MIFFVCCRQQFKTFIFMRLAVNLNRNICPCCGDEWQIHLGPISSEPWKADSKSLCITSSFLNDLCNLYMLKVSLKPRMVEIGPNLIICPRILTSFIFARVRPLSWYVVAISICCGQNRSSFLLDLLDTYRQTIQFQYLRTSLKTAQIRPSVSEQQAFYAY